MGTGRKKKYARNISPKKAKTIKPLSLFHAFKYNIPPMQNQHVTLVHALRHNASIFPSNLPLQWVNGDCEVEDTISYHRLWEQAGLVAQLLEKNSVQRGDCVMIAYPLGLDFLSGLFGCMKIGVIGCLVYPPNVVEKSKAHRSFSLFNKQVEDMGATFALTTTKTQSEMQIAALEGHKTNLKWLSTEKLTTSSRVSSRGASDRALLSKISPDDIAFIQYSSGPGTQIGVVVSHRTLIENVCAVQHAFVDENKDDNVAVTWMPQYHDYALIFFFLLPCFAPCIPGYACSPFDFVRNPLLWADMLEKFEGTHTAGPHFSYGVLGALMTAAGRKLKKSMLYHRPNIAAEPIYPKSLDDIRTLALSIPES